MRINTTEAGSFVDCAKEPIHIPGAVQPFGLLLGVDYPSLRIHNASVNCQEAFGISAEDLLGRSLAEFIPETQFPLLQDYLLSESVREQPAFDLTLSLPSSLPAQPTLGTDGAQAFRLPASRTRAQQRGKPGPAFL